MDIFNIRNVSILMKVSQRQLFQKTNYNTLIHYLAITVNSIHACATVCLRLFQYIFYQSNKHRRNERAFTIDLLLF
jgi:hypothetical protein